MERYGSRGSVPVEGLQSDPVTGAEMGLEESMWNLGLGGSGGGGDGGGSGSGGGGELSYPERPDEADCIYFLRTGFCGYGPRCRFNHPRDHSTAIGALRPGRGEYPERVGQPLCQYFMRTGMCKFGASCKYNHPRKGDGSHVAVNYLGYPLRPGEQECNYYMKTGQCKFGASCKFHHPQPDGIQMPAASPASGAAASYSTMQSPSGPSSQQYGMMAGNWQVARQTPFIPGSYIQGYGPVMFPPGMVPIAGWNPYPAPVNPVTASNMQSAVGTGPFYGITQLSSSAPAYTRAYPFVSSSMSPSNSTHKELAYPERPGQPECQFYLKTGDCKFGSSCRYHHPQEMLTPQTSIALSPMNLPLRPGAPPCSYYAQHGVCKFGPTCKYDHPMGGTLSYSPSASSLADMPVAPYPVGSSSLGTLPASYSSSDLLPTEPTSRSSNDSPTTTKMSSSMSTSSSVGSIRSKDGHAPHSAPSTGNIG